MLVLGWCAEAVETVATGARACGEAGALEGLTRWLAPMQRVFRARGYPLVFIGGGSARAVLDHVTHGAPLRLRDLDLFLVRGHRVEASELDALAGALEASGCAQRASAGVRLKRRANPALPKPARDAYVAGLGVHMRAPGRPLLSMSVLHRKRDLALNGLLDIDTIALRVPNHTTLSAWSAGLPVASHTRAWRARVWDRYGGYAAWRAGRPRVVHWAEVERSPARQAVRLARSWAKTPGREPAPAWWSLYRARCAPRRADPLTEPHELARDLAKLLADPHWTAALWALGQLGALEHHAPGLHGCLRASDVAALGAWLDSLGTVARVAPDVAARTTARQRAAHRASALRAALSADPGTVALLRAAQTALPSVFAVDAPAASQPTPRVER